MIKIKVGKKEGKRNKYLFVKFKYQSDIVERIKQLPRRVYQNGMWEIPEADFKLVLEQLYEYDLEFYGDLTDNMKTVLALEEQMSSQEPDNTFKFKTKPFPHQLDCFEYAKDHSCFILGDEQGLGKTKQTIDIAVARKNQFKHCLIICAVNGLKWNWQQEILVHSNEKGHILGQRINKKGNLVIEGVKKRLEDLKKPHDEFFLITNIETLRQPEVANQIEKMCKQGIIGMTVIDEVHRCKSSTSVQGKAIQKCCSYYKMALTGTPLMNSPIDLYNVLHWIGVEPHSLSQFKSYYCTMGGYCNTDVVGYKHLDRLSDKLDSCMIRRLKAEVLDLPPKIRSVEYVDMTDKQAKLYEDVRQEILDNIDKVLLCPNPLVELVRLRQCTGYCGILSTKIQDSVKFNRLTQLLDDITREGGKAIVFSNWTSIINPLVDILKKYKPAVITGDTKDRVSEQDRFMNDPSCKVILGTIAAMGTGLTLTAANTVIFMDECWNMANQEQAEDRAHRIGTKSTVNVISLICKNTIDEQIHEMVMQKGRMAKLIVDGEIFSQENRKSLVNYLLGVD